MAVKWLDLRLTLMVQLVCMEWNLGMGSVTKVQAVDEDGCRTSMDVVSSDDWERGALALEGFSCAPLSC